MKISTFLTIRALTAVMIGLLVLPSSSFAAELIITNASTVGDSSHILLPIFLETGGSDVSSITFQMKYDPSVLRPGAIEAGPVARSAFKDARGNVPSPGTYMVLIAGINQNSMGSGEVARIQMEKMKDPSSGRTRVIIAKPALSGSDAQTVPCAGSGVEITLAKPGNVSRTETSADKDEISTKPINKDEVARLAATGISSSSRPGASYRNSVSGRKTPTRTESGSPVGSRSSGSADAAAANAADSAANLDARMQEAQRLRAEMSPTVSPETPSAADKPETMTLAKNDPEKVSAGGTASAETEEKTGQAQPSSDASESVSETSLSIEDTPASTKPEAPPAEKTKTIAPVAIVGGMLLIVGLIFIIRSKIFA